MSHNFSPNYSLTPYWLLGFHHLSDIVYCPHGSQHDPINYETEHVISAQNLLQPFILLRTLWPSRLHIAWPLANLFDFIFCLTSLLKVHLIHLTLLHLENTKHASTHILCLWSSSKRHFVWLTSIKFLLVCLSFQIYLLILVQHIQNLTLFVSFFIPLNMFS